MWGSSFSTFDEILYERIIEIRPKAILDVGTGGGKIGKIVSMAARQEHFDVDIIGYEIFARYIGEYDLKWIYDVILNEDIMNIMDIDIIDYDIVFFGDSLEHLEKGEALELLAFLLPRVKYIIIVTPDNMEKGPGEDGNIYSAHLSNWKPIDFGNNLIEHQVKKHFMKAEPGAKIWGTDIPLNLEQVDIMNLFILKGDKP